MSEKNKKDMYKTVLDRLPSGAKGIFKDMMLQALLGSGETSQLWVVTALDAYSLDAKTKWHMDGIADHRSGGTTEQECEVIVNDIFRIKVEFEYEPPDTKNGTPESYNISCLRLCINNEPFEVLSEALKQYVLTDHGRAIDDAMRMHIKGLEVVAVAENVWDGEGRYNG